MPKRGDDKEASQIADLVETIRKKKGFKQLVTYNIQLLEKAVAPTKDRCVPMDPRLPQFFGGASISGNGNIVRASSLVWGR